MTTRTVAEVAGYLSTIEGYWNDAHMRLQVLGAQGELFGTAGYNDFAALCDEKPTLSALPARRRALVEAGRGSAEVDTMPFVEFVEAMKGKAAGDEPDGPCGVDEWRYKGKVLPGPQLTTKPYKLAAYLFERLDKKVPVGDLNREGGMFGGTVLDSSIQRQCSTISTWFAGRNVPLVIGTGDGCIWMQSIRTEK